MRLLTALFAITLALQAGDDRPRYKAYKETSLAGGPEVVTVQQPASDGKRVYFEGASVYCSVACDATVEISGTAATSAALTTANLVIGSGATSSALAFHTSNVGTGTVIDKKTLAIGEILPIDLANARMYGSNTARNLTIRSSSITGTIRISIVWREE